MNRKRGLVHLLAGLAVGGLLWFTTFSIAWPVMTVAVYWLAVGWPRRDRETQEVRPTPAAVYVPLYVYGILLLVPGVPQTALELVRGRFATWKQVLKELRQDQERLDKGIPKPSPFPKHEAGLAWDMAPGSQLHYRVTLKKQFQSSIPKFRRTTDLNFLFVLTINESQDNRLCGVLEVREFIENDRRDNGDSVSIDSTKGVYQLDGNEDPAHVAGLENFCSRPIPFQFSPDGLEVKLPEASFTSQYHENLLIDEIKNAFPLIFQPLQQVELQTGKTWFVNDQIEDLDNLPLKLKHMVQYVNPEADTKVQIVIEGSSERRLDPHERHMAAKCVRRGSFSFNATRRYVENVTLYENRSWAITNTSADLDMGAEIETKVELVKPILVAVKRDRELEQIPLSPRTNRTFINK